MYSSTPIPVQPQRAKQGRTAADLYAQRAPAVRDTAGIQQPNSHPVQEPDYTPAPIYQEPVPIVVWFHSQPAEVIPPEQRVSSAAIPHPEVRYAAPVKCATDDPQVSLPLAGDPIEVIEGMNSSPLFMRASANTLAEERSMMNAILSGNDTSFSTGLGIVLTPFAKNAFTRSPRDY